MEGYTGRVGGHIPMIIGLEIFFGTNFFVNLSWNLLARASALSLTWSVREKLWSPLRSKEGTKLPLFSLTLVVVVVLVLVVVPVFK